MKRQKFLRCFFPALLLCLLLTVSAFAASDQPMDFYERLFAHLDALDEDFFIPYDNDPMMLDWNEGEPSAPLLIRSAAALIPDDELGLDTAMMNIRESVCSYMDSGFLFHVDYLLNAEQLLYVDQQVASIVNDHGWAELSDYQKIQAVYRYVGSNFTYDDTLSKFTDYDGLTTGSMVCQGFALLTDKLLHELEIPCRIITGTTGNTPHGWNIVKLEGKWYCLDVTWDRADPLMGWSCFLCSPDALTGHLWDRRFLLGPFAERHPLSDETYRSPYLLITLDGTAYSSLTFRNGQKKELGLLVRPLARLPIRWYSTDESVVSVTKDGVIESLTPGFAYIVAETDMDGYLPAVFPVTAVDLRTCSPWAEKALTSYYLRSLYPAVLCSDYQTPIKRAELAHLLYQFMPLFDHTGGVFRMPGFTDIGESDYFSAILYTTARGIFSGTSETSFSPDAPVTREMLAKVLCTVLDHFHLEPDGLSETMPEDHESISGWAQESVDRILSLGLMRNENGLFRPKQTVTREDAAVILENFYVRCLLPLEQAEEEAAD